MKHSITKLMLLLAVVLCSIGANATYDPNNDYTADFWYRYGANYIIINGVTIVYQGTLKAFSEYPQTDAIDIIEIWDNEANRDGFQYNCKEKTPENKNWGGEDFIDGKATTIRFPEYIIINGTKYLISV